MTICTNEFFTLAHRMLSLDEAERKFAYDDKTSKPIKLTTGGNVTIGIGRNLTAKGLSPDEILYLLRNDINEALEAAKRIFPDYAKYSINRQLGIMNLIFNLGEGDEDEGFREFDGTISAIKAQDWKRVGANLRNTLWFKQVKERGPRVIALLENNRYDY